MGVWREMWREMWRENFALIVSNTQHPSSNPDRYGFFYFLWREKKLSRHQKREFLADMFSLKAYIAVSVISTHKHLIRAG